MIFLSGLILLIFYFNPLISFYDFNFVKNFIIFFGLSFILFFSLLTQQQQQQQQQQ